MVFAVPGHLRDTRGGGGNRGRGSGYGGHRASRFGARSSRFGGCREDAENKSQRGEQRQTAVDGHGGVVWRYKCGTGVAQVLRVRFCSRNTSASRVKASEEVFVRERNGFVNSKNDSREGRKTIPILDATFKNEGTRSLN